MGKVERYQCDRCNSLIERGIVTRGKLDLIKSGVTKSLVNTDKESSYCSKCVAVMLNEADDNNERGGPFDR